MTKARTLADNFAADINGITAGTGITGGGTSGTVTVTNSMATEIDAKGDLVVGTGADTFARLAVGNNGETLVANSAAATGLSYKEDYAAGKNKIINGDFRINQRGFTSITADGYGHDRWYMLTSDGTTTYSTQTFTAGAAPVTGYESINFARLVSSGQTLAGAYSILEQRIEDVRTFANQTVTISFWAKAASGTPSVAINLIQNFGSGGSTAVNNYPSSIKTAITTSWARYSTTINVASISGKTIGTSSYLDLRFWTSAGSTYNANTDTLGIQSATIDFWGVQVESGSVATAFQTATGTLQGELAACQRYYYHIGGSVISNGGNGHYYSTTSAYITTPFPVTMRTSPTLAALNIANWTVYSAGTGRACTSVNASQLSPNGTTNQYITSSATTGDGGWLEATNANAALTFSAEL